MPNARMHQASIALGTAFQVESTRRVLPLPARRLHHTIQCHKCQNYDLSQIIPFLYDSILNSLISSPPWGEDKGEGVFETGRRSNFPIILIKALTLLRFAVSPDPPTHRQPLQAALARSAGKTTLSSFLRNMDPFPAVPLAAPSTAAAGC